MSNVEQELQSRVNAFVAELSGLVRRAALEAVSAALGGGGASAPKKAGAPKKAPAAKKAAPGKKAAPVATKPAAAPKAAAASKRKPGAKRAPEEIQQTTDKLLARISQNPGERIEEIAKALGTTTKDLTLPVKKLLSDKKIRSQGTRRATKYFPR